MTETERNAILKKAGEAAELIKVAARELRQGATILGVAHLTAKLHAAKADATGDEALAELTGAIDRALSRIAVDLTTAVDAWRECGPNDSLQEAIEAAHAARD